MGFIGEFKKFAMRGNVVDMAVGIIIGAAFGKIVSVLVDKVMMPPLGYLMGGVDFADKKLVLKEAVPAVVEVKAPSGEVTTAAVAARPEVAIYYGELINVIINFVIVAFALFMLIKVINRLKAKEEAAPPPPPGPSAEERLLTEIRDLLKAGA